MWSCVVLRGAVQEHVHVCADVHMAQLQCARHREHKRDVFLWWRFFANNLNVVFRPGGQSTRERRIAVDVELEEVEEGIADEWDGAIDLALGAVGELQRLFGLFADWEGDPFELVGVVLDVFACFSATRCQFTEVPAALEKLTSFGSCIRHV